MRARNQITHDDRYSYAGLGPILPNWILTGYLSFLMLCISFLSLGNGRRLKGDV
jgi:hypothetical protein